MDEFIEYLLVMDELDGVFWGKEKDDKEEEQPVLKRTLNKENEKNFNIKDKK